MVRGHPYPRHPQLLHAKVQGSLLWINMEEKEPFEANRSYSKTMPDSDSVGPNRYLTLAKAHLSPELR